MAHSIFILLALDRVKENAVRLMKERIAKDPMKQGVSDVFETVNQEIADSLAGEDRAAFINKKGSFKSIQKSLYNVRQASVPNMPKNESEFDTTLDWFNYNVAADKNGGYKYTSQ